jgi:hypothetical protein
MKDVEESGHKVKHFLKPRRVARGVLGGTEGKKETGATLNPFILLTLSPIHHFNIPPVPLFTASFSSTVLAFHSFLFFLQALCDVFSLYANQNEWQPTQWTMSQQEDAVFDELMVHRSGKVLTISSPHSKNGCSQKYHSSKNEFSKKYQYREKCQCSNSEFSGKNM